LLFIYAIFNLSLSASLLINIFLYISFFSSSLIPPPPLLLFFLLFLLQQLLKSPFLLQTIFTFYLSFASSSVRLFYFSLTFAITPVPLILTPYSSFLSSSLPMNYI